MNDSNKMIEKMLLLANKFSAQRHITAIRDGFVALIPVTIIASFWLLINTLIFEPNEWSSKECCGSSKVGWTWEIKFITLL